MSIESYELPPLRKWQDFEDLCWELWRRLWNDPQAQKHGRSGQKQDGVDVFGRPNEGPEWEGVQCKVKSHTQGKRLEEADIRTEVRNALKFETPLSQLTIATTALRDSKAQSVARSITEEHRKTGLFAVTVASWEDIVHYLSDQPDLTRKYFSGWMRATGSSEDTGEVRAVPKLPPHYLERPEHLEPLKRAVIEAACSTVAVTGQRSLGIRGMGGIGKTVLAAAVTREPEVQQAFPDGQIWITVGQYPRLVQIQQELAEALGYPQEYFRSEHLGRQFLSRALSGKQVLLVLDDVWELQHALMLDVLSEGGRLIITTRDREILVGLGANELEVSLMTPIQSLSLLADWANQLTESLPSTAQQVAHMCGYLPLALAMIGAMVRLRRITWEDALDRLKQAELSKIQLILPDYPYPDLLRAIKVSVDALDPEDEYLFIELGIFPADASVPEVAAEVLWSARGLTGPDSRDVIGRLVARALVLRDDEDRFHLHSLLRRYVRSQTTSLEKLNKRMACFYANQCPGQFSTGPDDGYFFERLTYHLACASMIEELQELLSDYNWLRRKLPGRGAESLIADYDQLAPDNQLRWVQKALRMSAHVLTKDETQLAGQLLGRLLDQEGASFIRLMKQAKAEASTPTLLPLYRSLESPDTPLERTLEGHLGAVTSIVLLKDGRVASGSADSLIAIWNVNTGECVKALQGHSAGVTALCSVCHLGQERLVSASTDNTLRVWDIESGETQMILAGHAGAVSCVAPLGDSRIVSGSFDGTIRLWDIEEGSGSGVIDACEKGITCIAIIHDGPKTLLVSACFMEKRLKFWELPQGTCVQEIETEGYVSDLAAQSRELLLSTDGELRLWHIATGEYLKGVKDPWRQISTVAILPDGKILSGSDMGLIQVWDSSLERSIHDLNGHADRVTSFAPLADTRFASSSRDNMIRIWDLKYCSSTKRVESHLGGVRDMALLPNGDVVSASDDWTLRAWDAKSGRSYRAYAGHVNTVYAITALPNSRLVSAALDGTMRVWNTEASWVLKTFQTSGIFSLEALSDERIVAGCASGDVEIWDLSLGRCVLSLTGHKTPVWTVAIRADGLLVTASDDGNIRMWNPETGDCLLDVLDEPPGLRRLAALPSGEVACSTLNGIIRIWDLDARQSRRCEDSFKPIMSLATLDNNRIVTASLDRVIVWSVTTGKMEACFQLDAPALCVVRGSEDQTIVAGDGSGRIHFLSVHEGRTSSRNGEAT